MKYNKPVCFCVGIREEESRHLLPSFHPYHPNVCDDVLYVLRTSLCRGSSECEGPTVMRDGNYTV
jgi:hypothetical protein